MVCKGVCPKYKTTFRLNGNRYVNGQKRCNVCDVFVKWDGLFCPCCGKQLRTRPKISRYRRNYTVQIEPNMEILS
jgi:rRNA maturation endonuclease Nob1